MTRGAAIRALPRPDSADFSWDPSFVCLLVGDDATLATAIEKRLVARGWRVVRASIADVIHGGIDTALPDFGPVGAVISLAPKPTAARNVPPGDALLGSEREEAWLRAQFRLARQLSPSLNAPGSPRTWFVTVTRLDGRLGLGSDAMTGSVVTGGVFGLVKSLRLEWPSVFCRAIDVDPRVDAAFAAERIVEELHDPDQSLGEVGHALDGRTTIGVHEVADA